MATKMKLDFRFADEMDGLDIEQFVNEASAVEHSGEMSFRKESPVLTIEEVRRRSSRKLQCTYRDGMV